MLMLDASDPSLAADGGHVERMALVGALDMASLWQACSTLISRALPCHSCSLLFDLDGYRPLQGRHHLAETRDDRARLVTSLDVAAPYLDANPRIRWYTFSQIASQDALAPERLKAQDPAPGWREFIHLAFWDEARLEAVLSIRIRGEHSELSERELAFLTDLYPLLDASLRRVRTLESERLRQRALESALYELPIAIALVDADLAPLYLSQEARRVCRRWSDEVERSGRLPRAIETPLRRWLQQAPAAAPASLSRLADRPSLELQHPQRAGLRLRLQIGSASPDSAQHTHHLLTFVPDDGHDGAVDAQSPRVLSLLKSLSPSERKVATLVAAGLRNDAIAQQLCRSRKTIESQISSIFRKLNVANRTQLARLLN